MRLRPLFRLIIVLLLSFSTAFTPVARAAGESATISPAEITPRLYHRALKSLRNEGRTWIRSRQRGGTDREASRKDLHDGVANKVAHGAIESVAEVGRTVILILILTGAELVHQEVQKSHLQGKSIDTRHLEQMSLAATEHLLTDGQFFASMAGAGLISILGKKPLQIIQSLLDSAISRRMLVGLIQSGIVSFVTFTGWEAGAELWNEATLLIPNEKDFERSKNLMGVLSGAARVDSEDRKILGLLLDNLGQIILFDDDLRSAWLYNTWRLHIATGQFVVLVASMVSASVVGTALFPGAGTLAGMMFGAVGGLVSIAVPDDFKEDMSDGLRSVRKTVNQSELQTDRAQVGAWLDEKSLSDLEGFLSFLSMQSSLRAKVMTTYFEADYKWRVMIQALEHMNETARQTLEQLDSRRRSEISVIVSETNGLDRELRDVIASNSKKIEKRKNEIGKLELMMREFYASKITDLKTFALRASRSGPDAEPVVQALIKEINQVSVVKRAFDYLVAEGVDLRNPDILSWVQVSNFRGFKESRLLKALKTVH